MNMPLFDILKNPFYILIFVSLSFIVFDINYYVMANFPGSRDNMCIIGAGLTGLNISFSIILSLLTGFFIAGFIALYKTLKHKIVASGVSGLGVIFGFFTVFCTLCVIPIISLFGFSLSLGFFFDYDLYFKVLSILLMLFGLYLLNRRLRGGCTVCLK